MTDITATLRRYMNLFETEAVPVAVTITSYVAVDSHQLGTPPFPETMMVAIDADLDRDHTTEAIKAKIQAATGYEPASFTWKYSEEDNFSANY